MTRKQKQSRELAENMKRTLTMYERKIEMYTLAESDEERAEILADIKEIVKSYARSIAQEKAD